MRNALAPILWPALMLLCVAATVYAMRAGHGIIGFNLIYLALAVTLAVLERLMPHERQWLSPDGQMKADLAHTLFNKGFVQVIVVVSAVTGFADRIGHSGLHLWPSFLPQPVQILLALVVMEFGLYWKHRLSHETRWLWPYHAVHHSVTRLWFFNTGRFHVVDTILSLAFSLPLLFALGVPNDVLSWIAAITAYIGLLTHCNVQMRCGWLSYVFNTPDLHRWHHSQDLRQGNKNYGENLVLFDLLFGTFYIDPARPPANIGIPAPMPTHFLGQLAFPFRAYPHPETAGYFD
jgi:sterol desaturase/sphingolipid hydroxylase (fatty acid hydroxylase superfamily)